jgi:hypothetical protein
MNELPLMRIHECHESPAHIIEGIRKHKSYELRKIDNEFQQCKWYEIITYNSKQIQIFSIILGIGVQRSLVLPTQVSNCHLI